MRSFVCIFVSALVALSANADALRPPAGVEIRWTKTFASPGEDWINDIIRLNDGRFLAVGYLNRMEEKSDWRALAAVFDERGAIVRQTEYGQGSGIDTFWAASERPDGEIVHVGFTDRMGAGGLDAFVLRTDRDGKMLFEVAIGEAAYDRVTDIAAAPGGFLMVGHSVLPGTPNRRFLLVKTDPDGRELWRKIFLEGDAAGGLYIEPTPDGAFVLSGGTSRGEDGDVLLIKVDADGREIWRRTAGTREGSDVNHGVVVRPNGEIVAVGYTTSWGAVEHDAFAVTFDANGKLLRHSVLGGAGDDRVIGARLDGTGRIWIVGYTKSADPKTWDVMVSALDAKGCFTGAAVFTGLGDDNGTVVMPIDGGDLLVAGYSSSITTGAPDAFVMRTSAPQLIDPRFVRRNGC